MATKQQILDELARKGAGSGEASNTLASSGFKFEGNELNDYMAARAGYKKAGASLNNTMTGTQPGPVADTSATSQTRTLSTPNQPGSLADFSSVMKNISRIAFDQGPKPTDILKQYAESGLNLTTPSAIGGAISSDTRSRAGQIGDIYTHTVDLIKEQEAARQKSQEMSRTIFANMASNFPEVFASLTPEEIGGIQQGIISDTVLQKFGQAAAKPKKGEPFTLGEGQVRYDETGKQIAAGPKKKETQQVGNTLLEKDENGNWKAVYSEAAGGVKAPEIKDFGANDWRQWDGTKQQWVSIKTENIPNEAKIQKAQSITDMIDTIMSHPALNAATGPLGQYLPSWKTGTGETKDFDVKLSQLKAMLAIGNLGLLKGAMSDNDLKFIQQASEGATLDKGLSAEQFKKNLEEVRNKFNNVVNGIGNEEQIKNYGTKIKDAQNQGYQPQEIVSFLSKDPNLADKITTAKNQGYSDQEILDFVSTFKKPLSMGENGSITKDVAMVYPDGYKGGQCGDFAHKLVEFPSVGDSKKEKIASVAKYGIPKDEWTPQIGDVIITGENPTYGHVAVVNAILPDGKIQLSESNYKRSNVVSNDRVIDPQASSVYGAIRGKLKIG